MSVKTHLKQTSLSAHTMCGRKTDSLRCVEWEDNTWAPTCETCLRNFFEQVSHFNKEDFWKIANRVFNE